MECSPTQWARTSPRCCVAMRGLRTCVPGGLWGDPAGGDKKYGDGNSYLWHLNRIIEEQGFGQWTFSPTPFIFGRKENSGQGRASYVEPFLRKWLPPTDQSGGQPEPFVKVCDKRLQTALAEYHYKVVHTTEGQEITTEPVKDKHSGPAEAFAYLLAGLRSTILNNDPGLSANVHNAAIPSITRDNNQTAHKAPVIRDPSGDPNNPVIEATYGGLPPHQDIPNPVNQSRLGGITRQV